MPSAAELLKDEFEYLGDSTPQVQRFRHRASGIDFNLVAGGRFSMGFSVEEEQAATRISSPLQASIQEMRPVREAEVPSLLVSRLPVLNRQVASSSHEYQDFPAYLRREDALAFAETLRCRLPSEAEWEYFCRAGTRTLFPFGNALPPGDELDRWLKSDFGHLEKLNHNAFGLYGLFLPQWCSDHFHIDLRADAPLLDGSYVVRGGGAMFWPWQDDEWVWCMSAMRSPSSGLEQGEACLRLVRALPDA